MLYARNNSEDIGVGKVDTGGIINSDNNKMLKLTCLTAALFAAVTVFGSSRLAVAQNETRYVNVGKDSSGNSVLLDLKTIWETNYELISRYGKNRMFKGSYHASCAEKRLFMNEAVIYSARGQVLAKNETRREMSAPRNSAPYKSMAFVCRRIGAPGWGGL